MSLPADQTLLAAALSMIAMTAIVALRYLASSGLFAWLLSPPHTVTIGASGLVFGWLAYLLVRAVFTRNTAQIVIAVAVLVVYGSLLWGVLPTQPGVSWQAHLGGALGGALAARLLHGRDRASTLRR